MKRAILLFLLLLLIAAGAFAFRFHRLDIRPFHADESVQAAIFRTLWEDGTYTYNPHEFHGPTLPASTWPAVKLSGKSQFAETNEATFRIVPVLFGSALILLLWLFRDGLGMLAVVLAALLAAVSPPLVYYSRDYIHESLFVFFSLATIGCIWRYMRTGRLCWCLLAGVALGLIQATKETSIFVYSAMIVATVFSTGWAWLLWEKDDDGPMLKSWHIFLGIAAAVVTVVLCMTSLMTNPRGLTDAALTYVHWVGRSGDESPHAQPWYYYIRLLFWWQEGRGPVFTEAYVVVLALVGFVASLLPCRFAPKNADIRLVRWLGFYSFFMAVAYSIVPYKMPWLMLGFLSGMIILAGFGATVIVRLMPTKILKGGVVLLVLGGVAHSAHLAYTAGWKSYADPANPYAYVQTYDEIKTLAARVEEISKSSRAGDEMTVKVIWHDNYYWPLPWYLRGLPNAEHWGEMPDNPVADVIIASPMHDVELTAALQETHTMTDYYGFRRNLPAQLWVEDKLWVKYLEDRED